MKWFKHDSSAHNDEKIRELIHEFGVEGYGVYMICLELIAEKIDDNLAPELEISARVLSEKLNKRSDKVSKMLRSSQFAKLLSCKLAKDKWKLSCPNLLKRLDNWTSRYEVTTSQVSTNQNQNKNKNKKENKNKKNQAGFLNQKEEQVIKKALSDKNHHAINSEANEKALEELVKDVAKDKGINSIGAVALYRARK